MITAGLLALAVASSPFSLTLAPTPVLAARPATAAHVTVYDTGRSRLPLVTMNLSEIKRVHGVCKLTGPPSWAHITGPDTFALRPGSHHTVRVAMRRHAPAGVHDLSVSASVQVGHRGVVKLAAAVGTSAVIRYPGHVSRHAPKPCISLPAAPPAHPFPFWALEYGAVLLAILAAAGWLYRRHAGGHPERDAPPRSPAGPGSDTARMP